MFVSLIEVFKYNNQTPPNTKYFRYFQLSKKYQTRSFLCLRLIAKFAHHLATKRFGVSIAIVLQAQNFPPALKIAIGII